MFNRLPTEAEQLNSLKRSVVSPQSLRGDLVLLAHLDARLLEDAEPRVGQGLPHTHPLLLQSVTSSRECDQSCQR